MSPLRILYLSCLLLLTACGGEPPLKALSPNATILAFGDSLTYGTGAARGNSYPAELERLSKRRVVNAGIPGEVSSAGLARLASVLDEHDPDLMVLIHGGNDMLRRQSYRTVADNLVAMIGLARERGIDVVMVGVPKPGLILSAAAFYEEVAESTGTPIDADAIADVLQYPANKSDAVHPNASGYRQMAESIHDLLKRSGAL